MPEADRVDAPPAEGDLDSERTTQWHVSSVAPAVTPAQPATPIARTEVPSASSPTPALTPAGGWAKHRKAAISVAAVAVAAVSLWGLTTPTPTEIERASSANDTHPMGELVARAPMESTARDRGPSAPLEPEPVLEDVIIEDIEDIEDSGGTGDTGAEHGASLEANDAEASDHVTARRRSVAIRRARAEANRLVEQAALALEAGRRSEAILLYEQALELHPSLASAAAGLSTAYFDEGDFGQAVSFGEQAVSFEASNAEHHVALGDAYFRAGRHVEARKHWATADELGSPRAKKRLEKVGS